MKTFASPFVFFVVILLLGLATPFQNQTKGAEKSQKTRPAEKVVALFRNGEEPLRPYKELAVMTDDGRREEEPSITEKFLKRARKKGADALLLDKLTETGGGFAPFQGFKTTYLYRARAVAYTDGAGRATLPDRYQVNTNLTRLEWAQRTIQRLQEEPQWLINPYTRDVAKDVYAQAEKIVATEGPKKAAQEGLKKATDGLEKKSTAELKLQRAQCVEFVDASRNSLTGDEIKAKLTEKEMVEKELLRRYQAGDKEAWLPPFDEFKSSKSPRSSSAALGKEVDDSQPSSSGTGFFISDDGYLISNNHVVEGATQVRLVTAAGTNSAKVVKVDAANDLALLKAEGRFAALPVASSRGVKLGGTVATVGFPNIGLQGFAPKLAKGEVASLSGASDDARYFQISVPVQPGNSGGALVDERGNVVGVVSAKLSARAALAASGSLPENVNYAVKSSFLLSFLESVPEVSDKLKEPNTKERKFEDVVKSAEQAAALVLVY